MKNAIYLMTLLFLLSLSNCKKDSNKGDKPELSVKKYLTVYDDTRYNAVFRGYKAGKMTINYSVTPHNHGAGIGMSDNFDLDSVQFVMVDLARIDDQSTYKYIRYVSLGVDPQAYNARLSRNFFNLDNWEQVNDSTLNYTIYQTDVN